MVKGTWGWQSHGTTIMTLPESSTPVPVPFASLGVMKIDKQGRYTAHATTSVGGQVQELDLTGSIQVNADCTATEICAAGPLPCADRLVILNANEMRMMPTQYPLGPATGLADFRRLSWGEPHCSAAMVRGLYGGSAEGTFMIPIPGQSQPVPTPFSGLFVMSFQHGGTGTGAATASMAGAIIDVEFPKMSIEVNPDCTAMMKYTDGVSSQMPGRVFSGTLKYIVLGNGNELIGMETESSIGLPVEVENHKRISLLPMVPYR
ncbi:hypothetical protein [Paludibaculum fermentans]|uniref:hypothetical protein n=1 Tax=Paludibaculum fermentans TaxID=1473598 RepID=UPI003EC0E98C